jgi:hypothetical protein
MLTDKESPHNKPSLFKNPWAYSSLLLLAVAVYIGWIFLSRHLADRAYENRLERRQEKKQKESDEAALEQLGGSELAIQMLYATPEIRPGETAQVCFGVANAQSVTLEPQPSPVWPSHNLCVDVNPKKTTTYTLTATGQDGKQARGQIRVVVR